MLEHRPIAQLFLNLVFEPPDRRSEICLAVAFKSVRVNRRKNAADTAGGGTKMADNRLRAGVVGTLAALFFSTAAGAQAPATPSEDERAARRIIRIAVYDLNVTGVDERVATIVNEFLLEELRKLQRTTVIGYSEIRTLIDLEANRQAAGCDSEESCLAEVADALGSDFLITGTLASVGTDHVFGLKVLDQRQAKAGLSFNKVVPAGDGSEFLAEIGPAVNALFPNVPLKKGATRGVSADAARRLSPPPLPPIAFWSGRGVAPTALVGSLAMSVVWILSYQQYEGLVARAQEPVGADAPLVSGADVVGTGQLAVGAEIATWSLLGTSLVVAGATALLIPLTDFEGSQE